MYNFGILPSPCDVWPLPAEKEGAQFFRYFWPEGVDEEDVLSEKLYGNRFADGRCSQTGINGINRASWSVIEPNDQGGTSAVLYGAVPRALPQSSQSAEYLAAVGAVDYVVGTMTAPT